MEIRVQAQDTLWFYSQLFDIPLILITMSNPQVNPNQLQIGDRVNIPGYRLTTYTIQPNDSLWSLANTLSLPVNALLFVNQSLDPRNLEIGQKILIPERVTDLIFSNPNNYTYEKMLKDINRLQEVYPFIFSRTIGNSVMGKNIIELQIGAGQKEIHSNASFHANEWITTPVLLKFINQYALSLTNNLSIRGLFLLPHFINTRLSFVPMVNPDGVNLVINGANAAGNFKEEVLAINNQNTNFSNWKANIRGIDLNNQYPARWETEANRKPNEPKPRDYPGPYPLSEPEAIVMAQLTRNSNFQWVNAFHTQGEEIYWGFEGLEPPQSEAIVNEFSRVSGYMPVRYVDSYAGYKDWFIQDFRKPGFTIELGLGTNPLPIEQFDEIYEESLGILLANLYL
ncbi:M14 family metallopeptidase [Virgibacillus sp. W0181]|uniref:M14 family metallopeptidase n=1 Tax=Virgibacillus sp. W0181 TaxID=3391581 RepID=UPI003F44B3C7